MIELETTYRVRYDEILVPLAQRLEVHLRDHFRFFRRIDRVGVRAKSIDRFLQKAAKMEGDGPKYSEPLEQIQDQIGARIIAFYLQDVDTISSNVEEYFRKIESQLIVPDSEAEFGYFGTHYVLFLPTELFNHSIPAAKSPKFFELQIKTLYQHAWAEAEHDLGYKPPEDLTTDQRRKIAFTAAQSWGADQVFHDLVNQLGHRSA